jgi:hypothetical protein
MIAPLATFTWIASGLIRASLAGADQAARGVGQRQRDDQDVGGGQYPVQVGQRADDVHVLAGAPSLRYESAAERQ